MKTQNKIAVMSKGGKLLADIREQVLLAVRPEITTEELDDLAERLIRRVGGEPSFQRVTGYNHATCINLNSGVVHGIPGRQKIKNGDLVSIDIGLYYQGFHTDAATTVIAGYGSKQDERFLKTGREALRQAIEQASFGNRVSDISRVIQATIETAGFSCSRSLTGHGIGKNLHEEPPIPCFVRSTTDRSPMLKIDQTLAIEVIYCQGEESLRLENDGWTLTTKDGKNAALFEETILIAKKGPMVLTA